MNTILQKRIEEKSKELGQMFFPDNMNVFARPNWEAGYIETACKEIAYFALQNQWISVERALPPLHDDDVISDVSIKVIARTSDGVIRYAYYHHYLKEWFSAETSTRIDNVTKWMFVPEEGGGE